MTGSDGVFGTRETFAEVFTQEDRRRHWALVGATLEQVFNASQSLIDPYRKAVDRSDRGDFTVRYSPGLAAGSLYFDDLNPSERAATAGEIVAAYHASPLSVAADLAGWCDPIGPEKIARFLELQREIYGSDAEPGIRGLATTAEW